MDERIVELIIDRVMERLNGPASHEATAPGDLVSSDIRAGRVPIGVSARHCHLSPEHVEALFGAGKKLTVFKPLLQPGEFAAEQQVHLVSPAGRVLGPVRVLGPERKVSQVEVSLTDCYGLGLKKIPPVRPSGDHRDTFGITLVGPAGSLMLQAGLIRANRHVHLQSAQAAAMGLNDGDIVDVKVEGERPTVFMGCQLRAHANFRAEMHLDTDDANAAGIKSGAIAQILIKQ